MNRIRATYESVSNMGYIYFQDIKPGGVATSIPVENKKGHTLFVLDLDKDGHLIGIELFNAKIQMPERLMKYADIYNEIQIDEPVKTE